MSKVTTIPVDQEVPDRPRPDTSESGNGRTVGTTRGGPGGPGSPGTASTGSDSAEDSGFTPVDLKEFIKGLAPGGGGGGGGGGSSQSGGGAPIKVGGGGGSGGSLGSMISFLQPLVNSSMAEDPRSLESLAATHEADLAEIDRNFADAQDDMLAAMFGGNVERSTMAGDIGGRLIGDVELLRQRARADYLNSVAAAYSAQDEQRVGLFSNLMGFDTQIRTQRIATRGQIESARISAQATKYAANKSLAASKFSARTSLAATLAGLEVSQNQFGADLAFRDRALEAELLMNQNNVNAQMKMAKMGQPSTMDKILGAAGGFLSSVGAAGGFAAMFSDADLKEHVAPIEDALDIVDALAGVTWDWKSDHSPDGGVIAQNVEATLPEAVGMRDGFKTVNYTMLIGTLVEAVKALKARVEELEHGTI